MERSALHIEKMCACIMFTCVYAYSVCVCARVYKRVYVCVPLLMCISARACACVCVYLREFVRASNCVSVEHARVHVQEVPYKFKIFLSDKLYEYCSLPLYICHPAWLGPRCKKESRSYRQQHRPV